MRNPSEAEVRAALTAVAEPEWRGVQGWMFGSSPLSWHPEPQAMEITRVCLMLDQPVSDVITSTMWVALLNRIALIEQAVNRLSGEQG